jgi:ketosteroid isomerase-like protein
MHPNEQLLHRLYSSLQQRDAAGMAACYHDKVHFHDPAFQDLLGQDARDMWALLIKRGKDLQISYSNIVANDHEGWAEWTATYTFSATGRRVVNRIRAHFRFQEGKIINHRDEFNFNAWLHMAFGWRAWLFKLPAVRKKFHNTLKKTLRDYQAKNSKA